MDRDEIKATTDEELEIGKLLGFEHLETTGDDDTETVVGVAYNKRGEGTPVSDRRLKVDVLPAGTSADGLSLYDFRYLGGDEVFRGVMAQDLLADPRFAKAVITDGPYYRVDYVKLGLAHLVTDAMCVAGARALAASEWAPV